LLLFLTLLVLDRNLPDEMDDTARYAELPTNYRAILQIVQLLGWHTLNKLVESDKLEETAAR
jgi:hypothetical protein